MQRESPPTFDRRSHRLARRLNGAGGEVEAQRPHDPVRQVAASAQSLQGKALHRHLNLLRFPPELEAAFVADRLPGRQRHMLVCSLFAMACLMVGFYNDIQLMPELLAPSLWMRVLLVGAIVALALWGGLSRRISDAGVSTIISLQTLGVGAFILWLSMNGQSLAAITHSVSLFVLPLYVGAVVFQRFHHTLVICLSSMVAYPLLVEPRNPLEALIMGENIKIVWIAGLLSLVANYMLERHERHTYWLHQQALHQRLQLESLRQRLKRQSHLDPLTGLFNRRHFDEVFSHWIQGPKRPLSLLMIDVDHFKAYNDHQGHPMGDQCLRTIAGVLGDHARRLRGMAARVGGEEFAILLPHCSAPDALAMARALCAAVRGEEMAHGKSPTGPMVTVSVGVATVSTGVNISADELYVQADAALYEAKRMGRNQCQQATPELIEQSAALKLLQDAHAHRPVSEPVAQGARKAERPRSVWHEQEAELQLIRQTLTQPLWRLRLPDALQARFDQARAKGRQQHLLLMGVLGLITYMLMTLQAAALMPDIEAMFAQARELSMFALLLAIVAMMAPMPVRAREWLFALCASALGLSTLYLFSLSTSVAVHAWSVALFLIPAFSAIGARQPPTVAWFPAVSTVLGMLACIHGDTPLEMLISLDSATLVMVACVLMLYGCHTLEQRATQTFLLRRRDALNHEVLQGMSEELRRLALTDPLTGINNRRQFMLDLDASWEQAEQTQTPMALLIVDVDCFKAYNDRHGHAQGDHCLRQVVEALSEQSRQHHGLLARLGGEEFAVILNGQAAEQALGWASSVCEAVASQRIAHDTSTVAPHVTVSIGVAVIHPHLERMQHTELLSLADEALYEAKTLGRNRACQFKASGR